MSERIPRGVRQADGTIEFDGDPSFARCVVFDGFQSEVIECWSQTIARGVQLNTIALNPGGTFNYSIRPRDAVTSARRLYPCPFCGSAGRPYVATHLHDGRISQAYVSCDECSASGPAEDTEAAAVERWNTRRVPVRD
jgi:Lar family restriction alleviation protein